MTDTEQILRSALTEAQRANVALQHALEAKAPPLTVQLQVGGITMLALSGPAKDVREVLDQWVRREAREAKANLKRNADKSKGGGKIIPFMRPFDEPDEPVSVTPAPSEPVGEDLDD